MPLTTNCVHTRWMIRRDMPAVLDIEQQSFQYPWSEDAIISILRQRDCIGMVAEQGETIVGYMLYKLHKNRLYLLRFAVASSMQRKGVGSSMVDKLIGKLSPDRRNRIMIEVRETNLDAQLFFRAQGFKAISVQRDFFADSGEDAYLFQWKL